MPTKTPLPGGVPLRRVSRAAILKRMNRLLSYQGCWLYKNFKQPTYRLVDLTTGKTIVRALELHELAEQLDVIRGYEAFEESLRKSSTAQRVRAIRTIAALQSGAARRPRKKAK